MRIAQLSPLIESVPPKEYGGTERIVSYLTEELVRQGHEVTLYASGDSETEASLVSVCRKNLRSDSAVALPETYLYQSLERAFRMERKFDVLHNHAHFYAYPWASRSKTPVLTTIHERLDLTELRPLHELYKDLPLVSISDAQRAPLPHANWMGTVHHGLPEDLYKFQQGDGEYLAFLGRISEVKCPDHAIEIAKRTGIPLKIAAKVDPADRAYFEQQIEPLLDHPLIEFIGEITDAEKQEFLANALALVAPHDWPEPFGLVFIEALACGTPVLAYNRGSVPEIIDHGKTGFICNNLDEMAEAVPKVAHLSQVACREAFEEYFTAERMTKDYVYLYEKMCEVGYPQPLLKKSG